MTSRESELNADFVDSLDGRVLVVTRRASAPLENSSIGALIVPPFAEEMNKSRRLMTELAVANANAQIATLVVDLYGTGDSDGEFERASMRRWCANLDDAVRHARRRYNIDVRYVVAVRLGCILASTWLRDSGRKMERTVFWQPQARGEQAVTQMLRVRSAASIFDGSRGESISVLRQQLQETGSVEAAGYRLGVELCEELAATDLLRDLGQSCGSLMWIEIGDSGHLANESEVPPPVRELDRRGMKVAFCRVPGDPFWMSTETVTNPKLVECTVRALTA